MQFASDCFLIVGDARNADFYYLTKFRTTDPCIYLICKDGTELLVVPSMELRRAERESRVKEIACYEDLGYRELIEKTKDRRLALSELIIQILKECRAKSVSLPHETPAFLAFKLKDEFELNFENPVKARRVVKSTYEIENIKEVARITVEAFDWLMRNFNFRKCEDVRKAIELKLYEMGCIAENTIASSGKLSADPHALGSGDVEDHIVLDVFPRSRETLYYADFTRVMFLNKNEKIEEMYRAVVEAQEKAISIIKDGILANEVHAEVKSILEGYGFKTKNSEGFIHSTGHGIGLEIHEEPRISDEKVELKAGMVITVEPGLYYKDVGGVRVEDTVVVMKSGCEVLTNYKKWIKV